MRSYGVMFRREFPPERLPGFARQTESAGFDQLWVVEDLGYHGGFSQVGAALASTERLTVGLGIAPAVVRNAAFAAMEMATVERMFPGRFHMGFGHGVDTWIAQVGATPQSWLRSIEEVTVAAKRLVAGETVTAAGTYVQLDDVTLVHPAPSGPPVSFGVRQPKSIALARDVADGVILAECSGPLYVAETRAAIGDGKRLTVFVYASTDVAAVRAEIDRRIEQGRFDSQMRLYQDSDLDLYTEIAISGDPSTWIDQSEKWFAAGAHSVVWVPLFGAVPEELDVFSAAIAHRSN